MTFRRFLPLQVQNRLESKPFHFRGAERARQQEGRLFIISKQTFENFFAIVFSRGKFLINGSVSLDFTAPLKYFEAHPNETMNYLFRLIRVVSIKSVAVISGFKVVMCDNVMSPRSQTINQRIVTFRTTLADKTVQLILLPLV